MGGCKFGVWDHGAGGAKRPRGRPKAVLGVGAWRGSPLPPRGSGGVKIFELCMQNLAFWCNMGNNLEYIESNVTDVSLNASKQASKRTPLK